MKKIVLVLLFSFIALSAGTLRILNIPVYSTIVIDDQEYHNENKRTLNIELENTTMLSYNVEVKNNDFLPYSFSASISDDKVTIETLEMQYAKDFYTNVMVEDISGHLDPCRSFDCGASAGDVIQSNVYKFKENIEDTSVDFTVSRRGYYNETDSYDVDENQLVTIHPVSSWGFITIGVVTTLYPAEDPLILENDAGDEYMKYDMQDMQLTGVKLSYRKNTIFNIYLGVELNYLMAQETYSGDGENLDTNPFDDRVYDGDPTFHYATLGVCAGYRMNRLLVEGGLRQEMILISKTFADDTTWSYTESRMSAFVSSDFLFYKFDGIGGWSIGVNVSSEAITMAYLQVNF